MTALSSGLRWSGPAAFSVGQLETTQDTSLNVRSRLVILFFTRLKGGASLLAPSMVSVVGSVCGSSAVYCP
jgi:hypothetical protein